MVRPLFNILFLLYKYDLIYFYIFFKRENSARLGSIETSLNASQSELSQYLISKINYNRRYPRLGSIKTGVVRWWCGVVRWWCGVVRWWCGVVRWWCGVVRWWCGVVHWWCGILSWWCGVVSWWCDVLSWWGGVVCVQVMKFTGHVRSQVFPGQKEAELVHPI